MKIYGSAISRVDRSSDLYRKLERVHLRIAAKDPNTWGPEAAVEAAIRLNWVDLPETSRELLPEIDAVIARFSHIKRIVLAGMGGSSLAPEVIAQSYQKNLFILDSTDPHYVSHALAGDVASTLLVVSSKSGSTIETTSARALFSQACAKAGLALSSHLLVITDPGSPLDLQARKEGLTVINADPQVGGLNPSSMLPQYFSLKQSNTSHLLSGAQDFTGSLIGSNN
jgi:glucose-6-phosphate isomerase